VQAAEWAWALGRPQVRLARAVARALPVRL
jgi:hypothetical protein